MIPYIHEKGLRVETMAEMVWRMHREDAASWFHDKKFIHRDCDDPPNQLKRISAQNKFTLNVQGLYGSKRDESTFSDSSLSEVEEEELANLPVLSTEGGSTEDLAMLKDRLELHAEFARKNFKGPPPPTAQKTKPSHQPTATVKVAKKTKRVVASDEEDTVFVEIEPAQATIPQGETPATQLVSPPASQSSLPTTQGGEADIEMVEAEDLYASDKDMLE